jgi:hypothetical protein
MGVPTYLHYRWNELEDDGSHVSIDGGYRQFAGLHNGQILFLFCASQWWPSTINPLLINVSIQKHHILLNLGEGEDAVAKDDNDDWDKKALPISLISFSVVRLRRELFRAFHFASRLFSEHSMQLQQYQLHMDVSH